MALASLRRFFQKQRNRMFVLLRFADASPARHSSMYVDSQRLSGHISSHSASSHNSRSTTE
jgi:hypothetical protein